MRQRNDTPHPWSFAATPATGGSPEEPPFEVQPGGTVDRPVLLDGWTALDDEPESATAEEPAKAPAKPKRTASTDADKDENGGGPR